MPDPVVSVIIHLSNPLAFPLGDAIASASEQSFGTPEVIFVTTPGLFEGDVKTEVLRKGDSLRYYLSAPDTSPGGLLRTGTDAARGRFVTWLSADDLFDPRRIEAQMEAITRSGCSAVTCGSRFRGQSHHQKPVEAADDVASALKSLLNGTRDPSTLLISRECLSALGGFNPAFHCLFDLDLAIRFAMRFPVAHVSAPLVLRNPNPPPRPERSQEFRRIANRVLEEDGEAGPVDSLPSLGKIVSGLGEEAGALLPVIQRHLTALVRKQDLVVGILAGPVAGEKKPEIIKEALGVPDARVLKLSPTSSHLLAMAELLASARGERIILVDPAAPPQPESFALQLLHSAAEHLDACLPGRDPLVYTPGPETSLIPGALFLRSTLEKTPIGLIRTEAQFWAVLSNSGRIGALPPAAPIPRPLPVGRHDFPVSRMMPADLMAALIDRDWYTAVNPDIATMDVDPVDHFLDIGWRERRQPNPWFHTAWYLAKNPSVLERNMNPLEHFVVEGAAEGIQPSPGFDIAWYSRQYLDADRPCAEALLHFMTVGLSLGAVPYPRLHHSGTNTRAGAEPQRPVHPWNYQPQPPAEEEHQLLEALVDADWYRATYASRQSTLLDAAAHYADQGWRQGYNPNLWFDTRWYLSQNADARSGQTDPLTHFIRTGANRNRRPHAFFDMQWYAEHYLGGIEPSAEVLRHFLTIGLRNGAVPNPRIATPAITKRLLQIPLPERSPLIKRLQNLLAHAVATGEILASSDSDLWPLLLAEDFPPDVKAVLLICEGTGEGAHRAEAAAGVLPSEEFALFAVVESDHTLRIANRLEEGGISVRFRVPEQDVMLKNLLIKLNCQRAAAVERHLLDTPPCRMIRNVGVPVFINRPNPGAARLPRLPGKELPISRYRTK